MTRRLPPPARRRSLATRIAAALALAAAGEWFAAGPPALAASLAAAPEARRARLDPRLERAAALDTVVSVWVEFRDKGAAAARDPAAALRAAEAALTPRARARRLRAKVSPLVDALDLPVAREYLERLEGLGMRPLAVSRWANRAAVRIPAARLAALVRLDEVAALVPVATAARAAREEPHGAERRSSDAAGARGAGRLEARDAGAPCAVAGGTALDHGLAREQLAQLRLPALHACGSDGSGVLVCVLDNGFLNAEAHEALAGIRVAPGHRRDFVDGDSLVSDGFGHGTWVLGCLAGRLPGAYVGAAPGADYALARTERDAGESRVEMLWWQMGAEWADSLGADVLSSSLGYFDFDAEPDYGYPDLDGATTDVTRAARIAAAKGILVVNAVGNQGASPWRHLVAPADVHGDSLIAVGAVDAFGDTVHFSSAGPTADGRIKPDLVARGVSNPVISSSNPRGYFTSGGTSFATPLVAGLAACLLQARPEWTPQDVIRALRQSASHAARPDQKLGYGIPDAVRAAGEAGAGPRPSHFGIAALPNPLRSGVAARFDLLLADPASEPVAARLRIVDAQGRSLAEPWAGTLCFGRARTASWDGTSGGRRVPPGLYWAVLSGGGRSAAVRIVAMR